MAVNVFPQSSGIKAQKFNRVSYYQSSAVQNTLYTVLDITSGQGILNNINLEHGNSLNYLDFLITVDGTLTTITSLENQGSALVPTSQRDTSREKLTSLNPNITFYQSLKIQIRNTTTANNVGCFAQYNLV